MAIKRKLEQIRTEVTMKQKKKTKTEIDMLSNLPESLQLRILSSLETKHAVQTSAVSKTWFLLWYLVPVLNFSSNSFDKLRTFDKFVDTVLRRRNHMAKLDGLTFNRRGVCSANMLKNVLGYAFSHGAKTVEAFIQSSRNKTWPIISPETCSESLVSLKLESEGAVSLPFFGSRSGSFRNLSDVYLKRARILDPELFSRFPALTKLTLIGCLFDRETVGKSLKINAPKLTDLSIRSYDASIGSYQFMTPKLRFFEYRGTDFRQFQAHGGLPVLETVIIDFHGLLYSAEEIGMLDELLSLFVVIGNAKYLTLFSSVFYLLSLYPDQLVKQDSPFCNLKCLTFDLENFRSSIDIYKRGRWSFEMSSEVRGYLFRHSPNAEFIVQNLKPCN